MSVEKEWLNVQMDFNVSQVMLCVMDITPDVMTSQIFLQKCVMVCEIGIVFRLSRSRIELTSSLTITPPMRLISKEVVATVLKVWYFIRSKFL
jgi:hypothetical protein